MKVNDKKLAMADKMYKQNSTGGVGTSPKNYQNGKAKGDLKMKFKMNGETTGRAKGQNFSQSNGKGSFNAKYNQANPSGSMKGGYDM
jgi:hypothetical protein